MAMKIDQERDRFPYCIVWTPIPLLTWLLPFIGKFLQDSGTKGEGHAHQVTQELQTRMA